MAIKKRANNHLKAVILAGGRGSRLPIGGTVEIENGEVKERLSVPKQFSLKFDGITFIQDIVRQIGCAGIKPAQTFVVVTSKDQETLAHEQLIKYGVPSTNILLFDPHYGYVAVMAKAAHSIAQIDPEAVCFFSPSDQHIEDDEKFAEAINEAATYAETDPTIIGVKIADANIVAGCGNAVYDSEQEGPFYDINAFVEKPGNEKKCQLYKKENGEILRVKPNKTGLEYVKEILMDDNTVVFTGFLLIKASKFGEYYPEEVLDEKLKDWYNEPKGSDLELNTAEMVISMNAKLIIGRFGWKDCGTILAYYSIQRKTPNHKNAWVGECSRYKCVGSLFVSAIAEVHIYAAFIKNCAVLATMGADGSPNIAVVNMARSQEVGDITDFFEQSVKATSYSAHARNNVVMPSNLSESAKVAFLGVQNVHVMVNRLDDGSININVSANGDCLYEDIEA